MYSNFKTIQKKLILFLSVILACFNYVYSQDRTIADESGTYTPELKIFPPSPNAASLGKYGDIPVSLSNGTTGVSIPLYTIKFKDIVLPINLSYYSTGLKVEERASWVGLGWTLNAGGVITRSVKGFPDESYKGYLSGSFIMPSYINEASKEGYTVLNDIVNGNYDTEPDIFYFNFCGKSGKFVFDTDGKPYLIDHQDMIISYNKTAGVFTIVDGEGLVYTFLNTEISHADGPGADGLPYISSWYLTTVSSTKTNASLSFGYNSHSAGYSFQSSETVKILTSYYYGAASTPNSIYSHSYSYSSISIDGVCENSIISSQNETVIFHLSDREDDLHNNKLESITILKSNGETAKKINFGYGYFGRSSSSEDLKRLRLDYIQEVNYENDMSSGEPIPVEIKKNPYQFYYYGEILPSIYSRQQDNWGYFNRNGNESTMVPTMNYATFTYPGADKSSRYDAMMLGMLTKIKYPTGGSSEFTYEQNSYLASQIDTVWAVEDDEIVWNAHAIGDQTPAMIESESGIVGVAFNSKAKLIIDIPVISEDEQIRQDPYVEVIVNGNSTIYNTRGRFEYQIDSGSTYQVKAFACCDKYAIIRLHPYRLETSVVSIGTGGLRIKKIITSDGEGMNPNIVKTYNYFNSYGQQGGDLLGSIDYTYSLLQAVIQNNTFSTKRFLAGTSNNNNQLGTSNGSNIFYRFVDEYINYNNIDSNQIIKTRYEFIPPTTSGSKVFPFGTGDIRGTSGGELVKSKTEFVNKDGKYSKVKETINQYNSVSVSNKLIHGYVVAPYISGFPVDAYGIPNNYFDYEEGTTGLFCQQSYCITPEWRYLQSTTVNNYNSNGEIGIVDKVVYECSNPEHTQITGQVINKSDGKQIYTKYTYAKDYIPQDIINNYNSCNSNYLNSIEECNHDYSDCLYDYNTLLTEYYSGVTTNLNQLINSSCISTYSQCILSKNYSCKSNRKQELKNLLDNSTDNFFKAILELNFRQNDNLPIEKLVIEKNGDEEKIISGQLTLYKIGPGPNYRVHPFKVLALNLQTPISKNEFDTSHVTNDGTFLFDSRYKTEFVYDSIDQTGNILQYHKENDSPTSIIWDYNTSLPIAEIKGANYKDLNVDDELFSVSSLRDTMKNVMITSYTYDPVFGITSITDPNNITTYYDYDKFGRLSLIKDNQKNILKRYDYHYTGQELKDGIIKLNVATAFNAGGTVNPSNPWVKQGENVTISILPNTGYHVKEIKVNESYIDNVDSYTFSNITSNQSIDVEFEINSYTVTYSGNGSTGGTAPTDGTAHNYSTNVTVLGNTGSLAKTGYTFSGWNTTADGSGTTYSAGAIFPMGAGNVTLYAKWTINNYTVTYSGNGSTGGTAPTDGTAHNYSTNVTVLGNTGSLAKTGYTFSGWNTAANGSGTTYAAGNTFTMGAGNVTLYAKWTINSYTVTYSGNGSTGGTAPTDGTAHNYSTNVTVLGNTGSLAKTGYTFSGWNTAADGSGTTYAAGAIFPMGAGNVTLYAKWTINSYTVTFNSQGGSTVSSVNTNYNTLITAPSTPTRTGYIFGGWYKESSCTNAWSFSTDVVTAATTLYAKWAASVLNISNVNLCFESSGGTATFTITSNVSWIIYLGANDTWYSLSSYSGSNSATITVTCNSLLTGTREGTITIKGGGITKTISVDQSYLF